MVVTISLVEKWPRAMRKSFLRDRRRMQRWLNHRKELSGPEKEQDALQELNSLIGLEKVKHEIKKMINMVEFNKKRIASGKAPEKQTLHLRLYGKSWYRENHGGPSVGTSAL